MLHNPRGTTQIVPNLHHFRLQQALGTYAACAEVPTGKALGNFSSEGMGYFEGRPPGFHHPRLSMGQDEQIRLRQRFLFNFFHCTAESRRCQQKNQKDSF